MLPSCAIPGHITAIYIFAVINLMALFHVTLVNADVYVINPQNETLEYFLDLPAQFGPQLPSEGLRGYVVVAKPHNACIPIQPPPNNDTNKKWIVLIRRLGCDFDIKVHYAQIAGYDAAIVHNVGSDDLIPMGAGKRAGPITIPSAFMGESNALNIEANFLWRTQYTLLMDDKVPFNPNFYLLPFAIVVGICFLLMLIFMIAKWVRDLRKRRRSRLSQQHLKKLPTKKFKKGETTEYETCAICLDDYEDGDKLRVLPCSHAYHLKCVDPWLTNSKRTCPVCKRKVIPGDEDDDSDSDSDDEQTTASPSETTPLLTATAGNSAPGRTSTFDSSGLPAAMRNEVTHVPLQSSTSPSSSSDDDTRGGATGAAGQDNAQGRRKRRWRWRFRRKRPTTQPVDAMEAASSSTGYHSDDGGNNQTDYQTGNRIGAQGNWSGVDELSAGNVNQHPKDRKMQKQGSHDNAVAKQQSQKSGDGCHDNEAPEGAVGGLIDCDEEERERNSKKEDNENTISIEADVEVIQPSREEEKTKGGGNGPV